MMILEERVTAHHSRYIAYYYSQYLLGQQSFIKTIYSHWTCMWFFWHMALLIILITVTAILTVYDRSIIAYTLFRVRFIKVADQEQFVENAFKFLAKRHINVKFLKKNLLHIASCLSIAISMFFWFVVPAAAEILICNAEYCVGWLLNLSFYHIYTIIIVGWSSYSKYANLGFLRTIAQLVLYEVLISVLYSYLFNDLFFGQSNHTFIYIFRILIMILITMFIRSLIPRYRFNQLINLNWKVLLPILNAFALYLLYLENYVL